MIVQKILFLSMSLLCALQPLQAMPLAEDFKHVGYREICDKKQTAATFDFLYACFDELIDFFQTNPTWAQKLYHAKERFIRSKERGYYSTDFFGFYDESAVPGRSQISFYYSIHFHEFICTYYPELNDIPEISYFLALCREIQNSYAHVFSEAATALDLESLLSWECANPPILLKVIKYLPSYMATKPHYDGTAFSLFLDSTDNESLLLSAYKSSLTPDDFSSPVKTCCQWNSRDSILLIPGVLLTEFSIYPTPHFVARSGKMRYATIAFAMRPHYTPQQKALTPLPNVNR
ncbi:MAG TPA: hypothetical protein VGT41_05795 [Candidatus Babeliales bacterium]|nr:hypothetical protein [Candidatus Babeliales bacterium]